MDRSASSDVIRTLDIDPDSFSDYWTIIGANTSRHATMVSGSGRTSVLVFGGLLAFWSLGCHVTLLWTLLRRRTSGAERKSRHDPLRWYLVNASLGQLAIACAVLPVELLTEYRGAWTSGRPFCQLWRPTQVGLVALYFWSHFLITTDRYFRYVRPRDPPSRRVTVLAVVTSWATSFATAVAVTMVMRRHGAMLDDVCALDMSVRMAFLLSFAVYFLPAAFTVAASGALLAVTCRDGAATSSKLGSSLCGATGDHFDASARRLAAFRPTGSASSLSRSDHRASATLIASGLHADADADAADRRTSASVAMAANGVAIFFWMPFYVANLVVPFCSGVCLDPGLWTMFLWFGYATIGISPIVWIFEPIVRGKTRDTVD